ncbi:MAG: hypothetical protein OEU54_16555 [Gemmatimonadota bacterium]|nr:hypothetical protein [Gemmatimonadota bacterium]
MSVRDQREFAADGEPWILFEAHRSSSGLGLGYFMPANAAGGGDRRVALEPGTEIAALSDDDLGVLWEGGARLTVTERRFSTSDGEFWLAQAVGPAWGEGAAAGLLGLRITCISAVRPVREVPDVRLEEQDDRALAAFAAAEG